MVKYPQGSTFIKKKNAKYWAKRSGYGYRIIKLKSGYKVKLGKKK